MPVHGVLVQTQKQVDLVAVAVLHLLGDAHREEDVATADDGLIGVVAAQVEAPAHEYPRKDVAGSRYALSGLSADGKGEVESAH